jgi:hypothetical protein
MVASYSNKLRLTKQGTNDNPNTWGTILNQQVIDLIGDAIAGVKEVSITGASNVTLTTANGAEDQARSAVLVLTGALGADIDVYVPANEKIYFIRGAWTGDYEVTVKVSGSSTEVVMESGDKRVIYVDGVDVYDMVDTGISVTTEDTTPSVLNDKLTVTTPLVKETVDPGANETLDITFDQNFTLASVGLQGGQGFTVGGSFSTDIVIPAGAYSATDGTYMGVPTSVTKEIDGSWVEGTAQGGLDTGAVAINSTYYVFVIHNPTTETTDALFSLSQGSPVMPSGYTKKRLVGFIRTDESSLVNEWHVVWSSFGPYNGATAWQMCSTTSGNAVSEIYFVFGTNPAALGARVVLTNLGGVEADDDVTAFASD